MKISIILAHPNPGSFNHAIAEAAAASARDCGHEVALHDLYAEEFPPLFSTAELGPNPKLPPIITSHCEEIVNADGIVIVHPNWWGMPPAILTGWIDRVLRPGLAYRFVTGDNGEGVPQGLLKARAAIVLNTANTPPDRELSAFGDPLESIWKKCVFDLCGVKKVHRRIFSVVITSSPEQRQKWLKETSGLVATFFP